MSIETVASYINSYGNPEENNAHSYKEPVETVTERRLRLHNELKEITLTLHELQTRHQTLTLGMISLLQTGDHKTRAAMSDERNKITEDIVKLREEQGRLITDTARCNTEVWRPAQIIDSREMTERDRIERPYLIEIYNDGEDPRDLTAPSHDGEPHGPVYRYLKNAAV